MKKTYRAIDLFAGIGGIRLGFKQAFGEDIEFIFSNEINKYASETYEANFGENPQGDITELDPTEIPDFDLLLAGFPCQAFSIAGEKRGFEDTRGTLFFNVAEVLRIKKPIAFMLENVKNLISHDSGRTIQVINDVLTEDLKYNIKFKVLNAREFGVPQNRERIFIVGFRDNLKFHFPEPPKIPVKISDVLEEEVETNYYLSHEYLSGLKNHRARHEAKGNGFGYQVIPRNGIANALVCGGMGKERNLVNDLILPDCWKEEGDDIQLRNEEGIRKMTEREWARLQGFPDSFQFPVSKTQAYKQLGNSVAVPVIKAIANEIKISLDEYKVIKEPQIVKENKDIISVLLKMYSNKAITKTGKKFINSFEKFIKDKYLRVRDFNGFLSRLERYTLIKKISKTQIQFSDKLLNKTTEELFYKNLTELLETPKKKMTILDY